MKWLEFTYLDIHGNKREMGIQITELINLTLLPEMRSNKGQTKMREDKFIWIRCEDLKTERYVHRVLQEAQDRGSFPSHIKYMLSYGNEIKMMPPEEFLKQLESIVNKLMKKWREKNSGRK